MARHKNFDWSLHDEGTPNNQGGRSYEISTIQLSLLMDIRDELKQLNALLSCRNFTNIPKTLRAIQRNTMKAKAK